MLSSQSQLSQEGNTGTRRPWRPHNVLRTGSWRDLRHLRAVSPQIAGKSEVMRHAVAGVCMYLESRGVLATYEVRESSHLFKKEKRKTEHGGKERRRIGLRKEMGFYLPASLAPSARRMRGLINPPRAHGGPSWPWSACPP